MTTTTSGLRLTQAPIAKAELLIRKPAAEVFEAFVDPAITTKFWFTKSSGRLEPGRQVSWDWEMYGVSSTVEALAVEPHERIRVAWPAGEPATVEWRFTPHGDDATFVSITNAGFASDGDEAVKQAIGATEGFTLVLAGLKAWLEHGIALNLVADRFPAGRAG
ncbi:MAG TPA: SRPBCC family protein [Thermomicrobiales bacterium]|nr:SRPBCC family protein [Thermomicrobiales bacterium]